ncbi:IS1634 family transposase [Methanocalculus sp.]|uniref:IS1634 family transposase n=1 Tax=Methanocalculus sp. TaxID=2004547 RepID=UPI00271E1EFC|nr:IS1634 family transposase [Methanocalculus sp.]MDO8841838.1 IS1634 family transposase [Methanocalculus sp.]
MALVDGSNVSISHLGLVAGVYDSLGIGDLIDELIPKKRHHIVSHGTAVKALILNSLGYVERRLYIMPDYFDDIATERLLGQGIRPEHLNESLFGETLDAIARFDPTQLFTHISLKMMNTLPLQTPRLHHDTTSIMVTGEYDSDFQTRKIEIVRGYSKDHRNDLNQFIISLTTNQHGVPVFMEPLSGNASDKKSLLRSIQAVRENLVTDQRIYHIADSAFYTKPNLQTLGTQCFWISHVPHTIGDAKALIQQDSVPWLPCTDERYHSHELHSEYADVPQKWVMYHSRDQQIRSEKKFDERVKKQCKKDETSLKKIFSRDYACAPDAQGDLDRWFATHPRYLPENTQVTTTNRRPGGMKGRPKKDEVLDRVFMISCSLTFNEEELNREKKCLGRFILATNDCEIDPNTLLDWYKEQGAVERGFRFLKDNSFHISEIFLKNPDRIAAVSMLMVLSLMVYTVTQWQIREILRDQKKTVRDVKKQTAKPTTKRIYHLFRRVRQIEEVTDSGKVCRILNYVEELQDITRMIGPWVEKYYG